MGNPEARKKKERKASLDGCGAVDNGFKPCALKNFFAVVHWRFHNFQTVAIHDLF
jgi:hypothetical protein